MVSAIIFDFDGIILESVSIKTDAFRMSFSFSPEQVDKIVQFHLDNRSMPCSDKSRYMYNIIHHYDFYEEQFKKLSHILLDLVVNAITQTPFVDRAYDFLDSMSRSYRHSIVSATLQENLTRIVNQKGIFSHLSGSLGLR